MLSRLNYELPMVPEDFVHRIGRSGRASETGQAISLVCVDEAPLLLRDRSAWEGS
jgi:ATP-dependent RNA helicase RhlE